MTAYHIRSRETALTTQFGYWAAEDDISSDFQILNNLIHLLF